MTPPEHIREVHSHSPLISLGTFVLAILLIVNMATYYMGKHAMWSDVVVVFSELAIASIAIAFAHRRWFTWCNIFLGLMALFHIGYYLPAKLGLVPEQLLLPTSGPTADTALLIFGAAILSFALGCSFTRPPVVSERRVYIRCHPARAKVALRCGLIITGFSFACGLIFIMQIGGPLAILHFTYSDFYSFFTINGAETTRYADSFLGLSPIGLLLIYFGLAAAMASKRHFRVWSACTIFTIIGTLFFGLRGFVLLLVLGWAYLRHHMVARLNIKVVVALLLGIVIVIPWVGQHRNEHAYDANALSDVKLDALAPVVAMGYTYRSFYAMFEVLSDGTQPLNGLSYYEAIKRLVPLSGSQNATGFQRTSLWINELANPLDLAKNGAFGSSGIGEPFVNFGYPGVVLFFVLIGWGSSALESSFLNKGSVIAGAMLTGIIIPMGFYVRDDMSGTLRTCVWIWLLLLAVSKYDSFAAALGHDEEPIILKREE